MLTLNNIEVVYDNAILVLKGVSLVAEEGRITTLLGANGAGKTTTLKAISGLLHSERGEVTKGAIQLDDERLDRLPPHKVVQRGVAQVFEGRRVFENLTVEDNLVAGAHTRRDFGAVRDSIERVYDIFAPLKERRHQPSGYLSGGEQQMLVIGRALMSDPRVILLDEPSLGLAPQLVEEIFGIIRRLKEEQQLTVLLVEQNAALALEIADHGYVMENGRIVLEGPAEGCARIPTSRSSISGSTRPVRANPTATSSTTAGASAGCRERRERLAARLALRGNRRRPAPLALGRGDRRHRAQPDQPRRQAIFRSAPRSSQAHADLSRPLFGEHLRGRVVSPARRRPRLRLRRVCATAGQEIPDRLDRRRASPAFARAGGWPPGRKKKLQWVRAKSLAVMCPAFVVRSHDRRPRWEP